MWINELFSVPEVMFLATDVARNENFYSREGVEVRINYTVRDCELCSEADDLLRRTVGAGRHWFPPMGEREYFAAARIQRTVAKALLREPCYQGMVRDGTRSAVMAAVSDWAESAAQTHMGLGGREQIAAHMCRMLRIS